MTDIATVEISRLMALFELSLTPDVTDDQLLEYEALEAKYPSWRPGDAIVETEPVPAPLPRKVEPFTLADLEQIAKSQNCSVKNLKHRLIIQRSNSFYVIGLDGEYRPPIIKGELAVSLPRDLARVPSVSPGTDVPDGHIEWDKRSGETIVRKTVDEMLASYATVARKVVANMSLKHSYYDPETEIFYEHTCPMRTIAPVYNEQINHWLGLLGGKEADKLMDWIAMATYLNKPICAIYLHGAKDYGKTMLAAGLSRLWGEAPTELESAHDTFNSAITDNPLIFADEELPRKISSGFLRRFVGQGTHPLRRKNMPEAKLIGYFRLIIAANNPDLLKFDDEDFSSDDIEAIASRILYIKSDAGTSDYLRSIGGRAGTEGWVDGDMIAAHAMWLRENRQVVPGPRFLVQGEITDVHRRIATHGSIRGLVVEWICKAVLKDNWLSTKTHERGIQFGGGQIYVNTGFVKQTWEDVLADDRVPSLSKIGRALKPLTIPDNEGRIERRLMLDKQRCDFYSIDPQHIYDSSKSLQIANVDLFRTLIEKPHAYMDVVGDDNNQALVRIPGVTSTIPGGNRSSHGLFDKVK